LCASSDDDPAEPVEPRPRRDAAGQALAPCPDCDGAMRRIGPLARWPTSPFRCDTSSRRPPARPRIAPSHEPAAIADAGRPPFRASACGRRHSRASSTPASRSPDALDKETLSASRSRRPQPSTLLRQGRSKRNVPRAFPIAANPPAPSFNSAYVRSPSVTPAPLAGDLT